MAAESPLADWDDFKLNSLSEPRIFWIRTTRNSIRRRKIKEVLASLPSWRHTRTPAKQSTALPESAPCPAANTTTCPSSSNARSPTERRASSSMYTPTTGPGRFTPNTSGLGKELDFYGGPEDTSLDEAITRGEDAPSRETRPSTGDAGVPADMATLALRSGLPYQVHAGGFCRDASQSWKGYTTLLNPTCAANSWPALLIRRAKRLIHEQIEKTFADFPGAACKDLRHDPAAMENICGRAGGTARRSAWKYAVMSKLRDEPAPLLTAPF